MLKDKLKAVTSRVDRGLAALERLAAALEKIANKGPDRITIHQELPAPPKKTPEPTTWPGLQPHYPFPQNPWPTYPGLNPTYPGINPNVPGLGQQWTSLGSDLYPHPAEPETYGGLLVKTDSSVAPGTVRLEQPAPAPAPAPAEQQGGTKFDYTQARLKEYLSGNRKI